MVSSGELRLERGQKEGRIQEGSQRKGNIEAGRTNDIPKHVEAGHDADEEDLVSMVREKLV